nr:uncharacterized protein LOC120971716 [Aegilops tauschii subsp. strangulata]
MESYIRGVTPDLDRGRDVGHPAPPRCPAAKERRRHHACRRTAAKQGCTAAASLPRKGSTRARGQEGPPPPNFVGAKLGGSPPSGRWRARILFAIVFVHTRREPVQHYTTRPITPGNPPVGGWVGGRGTCCYQSERALLHPCTEQSLLNSSHSPPEAKPNPLSPGASPISIDDARLPTGRNPVDSSSFNSAQRSSSKNIQVWAPLGKKRDIERMKETMELIKTTMMKARQGMMAAP